MRAWLIPDTNPQPPKRVNRWIGLNGPPQADLENEGGTDDRAGHSHGPDAPEKPAQRRAFGPPENHRAQHKGKNGTKRMDLDKDGGFEQGQGTWEYSDCFWLPLSLASLGSLEEGQIRKRGKTLVKTDALQFTHS